MKEMEISLLWPSGYSSNAGISKKLSPTTTENLNLSELCASIVYKTDSANSINDILVNLCCDEEVIAYRQEIFSDLIESPSLIDKLQNVLHNLENLDCLEKETSIPDDAKLFRYFTRIKDLNEYISCMNNIIEALHDETYFSRGLKNLYRVAKQVIDDPEYRAMKTTIRKLIDKLEAVKSINIGLNLDSDLNPVEATLVSVNKTKYNESWLYEALDLAAIGGAALNSQQRSVQPEHLGVMSKIHSLIPGKRHPFMYHFYKDIESFLKPVVKEMHSELSRYAGFKGRFLKNLIPELSLYVNLSKLIVGLKEKGMPFCRPEIAKPAERICIIRDAYNINLTLHMLDRGNNPVIEMVTNDINFDDNGRIMILTGPNRGGKTVYTETIGLEHVLFQVGAYIPGTYACISPVDSIYSHFPVDENQTVELGRLGEESKRLNEIFRQASPYSLILLNESFTSTSFTEALYIAQDVVKSMKYMGVRAIYNTHMHDLANYAETINREVEGDSVVVSLITDVVDRERSYKIKPGAPLGKSYARDIALQFGICFDQVTAEFDRRQLRN